MAQAESLGRRVSRRDLLGIGALSEELKDPGRSNLLTTVGAAAGMASFVYGMLGYSREQNKVYKGMVRDAKQKLPPGKPVSPSILEEASRAEDSVNAFTIPTVGGLLGILASSIYYMWANDGVSGAPEETASPQPIVRGGEIGLGTEEKVR